MVRMDGGGQRDYHLGESSTWFDSVVVSSITFVQQKAFTLLYDELVKLYDCVP